MSTFLELKKALYSAQNRRCVLKHLIDVMESDFIPVVAGEDARRVLLNDEQVPVPKETFNEVIEKLYAEMKDLDEDIEDILGANLTSKGTPENG